MSVGPGEDVPAGSAPASAGSPAAQPVRERPAAAPSGPWGRAGHPSRCATVVHDGGDRVDVVTLWLAAPRAAHLGDQVGWPRGGLAPSATYSVRLGGGGYLLVVNGRLESWGAVPGAGPVLTPAGELDEWVPPGAGNVVPLHHRSGPAPGRGADGLSCPCRGQGVLRVADQQDERRERDRARYACAVEDAQDGAAAILAAAVRPDGTPDLPVLIRGLRAALSGAVAVGPFAQRIAAGLPSATMAEVLRQVRPAPATVPAPETVGPAGTPTIPGAPGTPDPVTAGSRTGVPLDVAYRVLVQRALAVHGAEVLDAVPARFVADGMAAQALVLPRLERLLGRPLPGELGRLARWSLHGLDEAFGEIDPELLRITMLVMGAEPQE